MDAYNYLIFTFVFGALAWLLYSDSRVLIAGRWLRLFGWFLGTLAILYLLSFITKSINDPADPVSITATFIRIILASGNNLLLLLVAFELLGKNTKKPTENNEEVRENVNERENILAAFFRQVRYGVPPYLQVWAVVAALLRILDLSQGLKDYLKEFSIFHDYLWIFKSLVRLPESIFSTVSLVYVGFAVLINLLFIRRQLIAVIGILVILCSIAVQLLLAINPAINHFHGIESNSNSIPFLPYFSPLLNIFLFSLFYYLGYRALGVFNYVREIVNKVTLKRQNFLSSSGILKAICEGLNAEEASIYIKAPDNLDPKVTIIKWESKTNHSQNIPQNKFSEVSLNELPEVEKIFETGKPDFRSQTWKSIFRYFRTVAQTIYVRIPLFFNGAVIGCLEIKINEFAVGTTVVIQQIHQFSLRLFTAVQARREAMAFKRANDECTVMQFDQAQLQADQREDSSDFIIRLTKKIHRILSPAGIRIKASIGFKELEHVIIDGKNRKYLEELSGEQDEFNYENENLKKPKFSLLKESLTTNRGGLVRNPFGDLYLLIARDKDEINKPTLGIDPLNRQAIANVISDAIVELAQDYLNKNLTKLSIDLSQEPLSVNQWFDFIAEAIDKAELQWVVATNPNLQDSFFGEEENIRFIKDNWRELAADGERLFTSPVNKEDCSCVITLQLPDTRQILWLGVQNPHFGFELIFNCPWKLYLQHLAEIADAVLFKLQAQQSQVENTSYQAIATVATVSGTIIHQLINMARNQASGCSTLYEDVIYGKLGSKEDEFIEQAQQDNTYKELILALKESGERMLELTQAFSDITKFSEECPSQLLKAALESVKLFRPALLQNNIVVETDIDPKLMLNVPFHVAALTLANLVSNSKDALRYYQSDSRVILIKGIEQADSVICNFIDNGPGIPEEIKDKIFNLGETTKSDGTGSGWGLYLVKRALRENGCKIELISITAGHTEFAITFPKLISKEK